MALVSYKGAPQYLFAQVSNANSSVSALNNAATFTGQFEECHHYPCVHISLITDQSGVLYIDFSNDETNINTTDSFNITASSFTEKLVSSRNRYFRVRFLNNSGSSQTYIRLETKLSYKDSIQPTDGSGSLSGTFTPSGLRTGGLVTEVTLNSTTWTALPATALANRNAISLQNLSGLEVKVNYSSGVSGYVGMVLANGSERFYDITDDIVLYAKSSSGTPTINVEEIA